MNNHNAYILKDYEKHEYIEKETSLKSKVNPLGIRKNP